MPITKEAKLESLRVGMRGEFKKVLDGTENEWKGVATAIPSTTGVNAYGWMSDFPQLVEWTSDRAIKNMKEYGFTVVNKKYEATLGIKRTDLEDDNLGMYGAMAGNLASEVLRFQNENIFKVLKAGDSSIIYDGQNFFDVDHPVYPNADGTGTAKSVSNILGTAGKNKVPWYLLDASRVVKPLIIQERTKPEFENITNTEQSHVFIKDEYLVGIRYRVAFTSGFWQLALKSYEDLTADTFNAAYAAMMAHKSHGGRPLGIRPTTLVVPAGLRAKSLEVIKAERLGSGATNTNYNAVTVLVSAYL